MMVVMVVMFPDLLGAFMSVGEPDYGDGDQLTCNVVLEGIGICRYVFKKLVIVKSWFISTSHISILNRKGFPNRMVYKDFQSRYGITLIKLTLILNINSTISVRDHSLQPDTNLTKPTLTSIPTTQR